MLSFVHFHPQTKAPWSVFFLRVVSADGAGSCNRGSWVRSHAEPRVTEFCKLCVSLLSMRKLFMVTERSFCATRIETRLPYREKWCED